MQQGWLLRPPELSCPGLPQLILACPHPAWRQLGGVAQPHSRHCPLVPASPQLQPEAPAALGLSSPCCHSSLSLSIAVKRSCFKALSCDVSSLPARPTMLAHLSASQVPMLGF